MTIAIHRQPRFQKMMLAVGLVAVLTVSTLAVVQVTKGGGDGSPIQPAKVTETHRQLRLQSIQDGYLTPPAIRADQSAERAWLAVQDGYLPRSEQAPPSPRAGVSLDVQDGFLPPSGWEAPAQSTEEDAIRLGARGPQ